MAAFFYNLIPFALAAIVIVLFLGLFNMARGKNPQRSQNLMRARVFFQAVALAIIVAAVYLIKS